MASIFFPINQKAEEYCVLMS